MLALAIVRFITAVARRNKAALLMVYLVAVAPIKLMLVSHN
jgi:hypothetical protein